MLITFIIFVRTYNIVNYWHKLAQFGTYHVHQQLTNFCFPTSIGRSPSAKEARNKSQLLHLFRRNGLKKCSSSKWSIAVDPVYETMMSWKKILLTIGYSNSTTLYRSAKQLLDNQQIVSPQGQSTVKLSHFIGIFQTKKSWMSSKNQLLLVVQPNNFNVIWWWWVQTNNALTKSGN